MLLLKLLLLLLAVFLAAGFVCMNIAMRRGRDRDPLDPRCIEKSAWSKYREPVLAGAAWLESQAMEEIFLDSFDGLRLRARLLPADHSKGVLLLFHGYRSAACIDFSCAARYYHQLGFTLLLVDQRSHGKSQGRYITYGVLERQDCRLWAEFCYRRFGDGCPLFLSGVSMGATTVLMASELSLPPTVRGILADCGFTSPWDIIGHVMKTRYHLPRYPLLWSVDLFARLLARCGLRQASTETALAHTHLPVLLVHGTGDRFVPCDMSRRAYEACRSEKHLLLVEGAGHGASFLVDHDACTRALEAFLFSHLD